MQESIAYQNENGQSVTEYVVIVATLLLVVSALFSDTVPFNFLKKISSYEKIIFGVINKPTP